MDLETETPLTERKMVRRGLLAGLAGLGAAAMMKLSGTEKAEAVHQPEDIGLGLVNVGGAQTTVNSLAAGGGGYTVLRVENFRIADAIEAFGGPGSLGNPGQSGLVATGGVNNDGTFATPSPGGDAIVATGGTTAGHVGNGGIGVRAVGGAAGSGTGGIGVQATGGAPSGIAVRAIGGGTAGSQGAGVHASTNGTNPGVLGVNPGNGPGVEGQAAGTSNGVRGAHSSNGTGVKGVSNSTNASSDGNGSGIGVHGKSGSGVGVQGESNNYGVIGRTTGGGVGVLGEAGNGYGIYGAGGIIGLVGISTSSIGLWGQTDTSMGVAGYSTASGTAVNGTSRGSGTGVHGESASGTGVLAIAKVPNVAALNAVSTVVGPGKIAATFTGDVIFNGSYMATGAKLAIVPHPDGSMRSMYCTEATEPYFEDFGRAQLVGGVARVRIDPDFAPLVHRTAYHVFPVAEGDCHGLFVSQQDPNGFEVRELQGGKSSVPFSYRIVAKRVDIAGGAPEACVTGRDDTLKAQGTPRRTHRARRGR